MHIIRFGLRIKTGAERTTIVDIFDINQQVRDTDIHLKVLILIFVLIDRRAVESPKRQMRGRWAKNFGASM